jgi:hypothetical protein
VSGFPANGFGPKHFGRIGRDALATLRQQRPQTLQVAGCGPEPVAGPQQLATLIGQAGLARCTHRDVDPHPKNHFGVLLVARFWLLGRFAGSRSADRGRSAPDIR